MINKKYEMFAQALTMRHRKAQVCSRYSRKHNRPEKIIIGNYQLTETRKLKSLKRNCGGLQR